MSHSKLTTNHVNVCEVTYALKPFILLFSEVERTVWVVLSNLAVNFILNAHSASKECHNPKISLMLDWEITLIKLTYTFIKYDTKKSLRDATEELFKLGNSVSQPWSCRHTALHTQVLSLL